jgi:hypothetical protein
MMHVRGWKGEPIMVEMNHVRLILYWIYISQTGNSLLAQKI